MFKCFKCGKPLSDTKSVIKHLRTDHVLYDGPYLYLKCCKENCSSSFRTFSGLRRHLLKYPLNFQSCNSIDLPPNQNNFYSENLEVLTHNSQVCTEYIEQVDVFEENLEKNIEDDISLFAQQLSSLTLPYSTMQKIYEDCSDLVESLIDNVANKVSVVYNISSENNDELQRHIFKIKNELIKFNSIYKRNAVIKSKIVMPKEISIGIRRDKVFDRKSNKYIEKNLPCTFQYIPLLETLSALLQMPVFIQFFMNKSTNVDILEDFTDGSYFKTNTLFSQKKYTLQLQLFFDEFETTNPLGTKTGAYKMGAIYFTIKNLPSYLNSKLAHIHLLALFHSSDLKVFGFNEILLPIVLDLKKLETEGICTNLLDEPVFGTISSLCHDNLGANLLFGMVESFSATFYCRICLLDKNKASTTYTEDPKSLRTTSNYEDHCEQLTCGNENNVFGIKFRSILNELNYFKLCENRSLDIMHDILEGIAQYEIKLLIKHLITEKITTISEINERIKVFNYGIINREVKPSPISLDKPGHLIGQRASQTWCLLRYLPLIIGDLIPEKYLKKWNIYLLLLKISNIVFAPKISKTMISELRILIEEHHINLRNEYGVNLLPKHHFLTHYPKTIEMMGPLIHLWAMRFEAKHNVFKRLAQKHLNFKNLPKTLCERHQQLMYISWNCDNPFVMEVEKGPIKKNSLDTYAFKYILLSFIDLPDDVVLENTSWVKCGYLYRNNFFICTNVFEDVPNFEEILDIVLIDGIIFFITKCWKTITFNIHYHSYQLKPSGDLNVIDLTMLVYKEPYELAQYANAIEWYIVPKHTFIS